MLRIVDRYLVRELLVSFLAAVAILLLVTVGATVADLLAKIARGRVAADLLLALIGLRTVDSLTLLVPMALFLGVQLAYGRLYRESEMAVFAASGLPVTGLVRPLLLLALPLTLVMALISFWLAPAAVRQAQALQEEASRSLIVAGLEPGRFVELPNNDGVMYVDAMNADGTKFKKMFVASERTDAETGRTNLNVITAADGELYHDANGAERYLGLNDGFRVEGVLGQDNYRLMRYARNDVKLTDTESDANADSVKRSAPTMTLLASNDVVQRTEFQWRLAAPLSVLVLMLLALPLAKSSPREPRYARLLIALLSWVIYYNCLAIGRSKLSQGVLDPSVGFWWVQIPTALFALYLLWRSQRLPRPRPPAARVRAGAA
ncbi:MAG TPA: LPS export ABC transporter permease LptF [Rudaea sp.]|nr:LPS export ABC transporter permease LptF [Rudaea sp.]